MKDSYDVIVVGGGTAGVCAAVQAGRAGASTLLVEKTGILGGTLTIGAVNYPAGFHAWGRQVVAGIGWELVTRTLAETDSETPVPPPRTPFHVAVNRAIFAAVADEAVLDSGAELLLHTMPAAIEQAGDGWALTLCTKTGLRNVSAGVVIDCTGDANVVTLAGLDVRRPETLQPSTLVVSACGYDAEALDYEAIQQAFDQAVADGRVRATDVGWKGGDAGFFLRSYGGNRIHVVDIDASTSEGRTAAEIEGRAAMMRLLRFFRTQPGLEDFGIAWMADECGIRETVTIRGRTRVTIDDYLAGRVYDDAVCYSHYPVDIHCPTGIDGQPIPEGVYPTLPLGAMIPAGSRRLLAAGRIADGDRRANSSFRVEAPCMAMGQAVGAAAVLAVRGGCDVHEVPTDDLRTMLEEHGAVVPEKT